MKRSTFVFALATMVFAACESGGGDEFIEPADFVLQKADVEPFNRPLFPSRLYFEANLSATPVPVPVDGRGQIWDLSNLSERSATPSAAFIRPPANAAFAGATSAYPGFFDNNLGAASLHIPCTFFRLAADDGLYQLGLRQDSAAAFPLPASIGGSVTIPAQNIAGENGSRRLLVRYPGRYNDTFTSVVQFQENFVVNAPAVGLNGVPGMRRNSYRHEAKIIGVGHVRLKNIGLHRAVMVYDRHTDVDRYFLAGQLAPANLLATMGLSQEATTVGHFYDVYAEGLGLVASYVANNANTAITKLTVLK